MPPEALNAGGIANFAISFYLNLLMMANLRMITALFPAKECFEKLKNYHICYLFRLDSWDKFV
jgi:hypothetical protein